MREPPATPPGRLDWTLTAADLGPRLFRYFGGRSRADASDLVQETLLRLLQRHEAGAFDPARGSLAMFAFGIAHRVRLESRKAAARDAQARAGDEAALDQGLDERLAVRRAIDLLPGPQQDVVLLLVDRDLTLTEIGAILDLPLNTVKSHVHRAKATLRATLER